jgi:ABC-type multidrug transport system ATPase subunit
MNILEVNELHKHYGPIHALKGISFDVPAGSVYGILGPNGSGKTTLLGIVMDVLQPTSGTFSLFGSPPSADSRKKIGTLLETPNFYPYLSGEQNLRIAARIKGRGESDIPRVLQQVDLEKRKHSKFSTYSLGMKQRLAVASCLLGDPDVLVFDEPTNGLDPVGIAETRELIKRLNASGKTIIMASHLLDEVEKVCTHVAIMQTGKLLSSGEVNEILVNEDIVEVSSDDVSQIISNVEGYAKMSGMHQKQNIVELRFASGSADLGQLNTFFFQKGIVLTHLRLKRKSLESRFFELTQN